MRTRTLFPIVALASALLPVAAIAATQGEASAESELNPVAKVLASETLHGAVSSVDQGNDAVVLQLSQGREEIFRVQDGLVFDAVRFGDPVEVLVQTIAGARTIVRLSRE